MYCFYCYTQFLYHFPIELLYPQTKTVSLAAECVAKYEGNDDFWEFSDAYFAGRALNNDTKSQATLVLLDDILEDLNLDSRQVRNCIDTKELIAEVDEDMDAAIEYGVRGAPSTFIVASDGEIGELNGAQPTDVVRRILEEILLQSD